MDGRDRTSPTATTPATILPCSNRVETFWFSARAGRSTSGTASTLTQLNGDIVCSGPPLLLPTGQVLLLGYSSVVLYTPTGSAARSLVADDQDLPKTLTRGQTYKITGTQFNGFGQAMSFGDEYENATNYPLVRITITRREQGLLRADPRSQHDGRRHRQTLPVSTNFDVPAKMDTGASKLVVVANGIASKPVKVTIK